MKLTSRRDFLASSSLPLFWSLLPKIARSAQAEQRESTGFYRVESREGVWWFIDPKGKPIVSIGVNHTEPGLMLGSYNREATLERYGKDFVKEDGSFNPEGDGARKWVNQIVADLNDWGFNALGFHNGLPRPLFKDKISFVQPIKPYWITPYGRPAEFTDVFSEEVAARIDKTAQEVCLAYKDAPNLLGYVYNDRPRYSLGGGSQGARLPVHPWIEVLRTLGPTAPGKQKWIEVLKSRHPDAHSAGKTHGVEATTWDELLARTEWPNPEDPAAVADKDAFLPHIVEQWYKLHYEALRKYDPNHLILGDKLGGGFASTDTRVTGHPNISDYFYPILKKYLDAILLEWYGRFDDQILALRNIHKATGKPILLGDSSFSELQPRQENCKGIRVNSQAEVGEEYTRYLQQAMAEPFILGWHFCGYIESWSEPGRGGGEFQAQNGFKDPLEKVHEEAIVRVRAANQQAQAWHEKARA